MIALPNDITFLKAKIQILWEENEQLKAENSELRCRLGLNSTNSSKPPSSDGLKKKPITPAIPREKHKKGGQKGHKGNTLKRVANPDKIIKHLPTKCQCCWREFTDADKHEVIQNRQVFYLPQPKLEVTEHQLCEIYCCGVKHRGEYQQASRLIQEEPQSPDKVEGKKWRPKKSPGRNLLD
jgi:regulator of replication initiation timing